MSRQEKKDKMRKVTLGDVATRAGVTKSMVSRAFTPGASIAESSRERVLQAARELGYRPNLIARSLTSKRTSMVAVVVDDFANPNVNRVLEVVSRRLQQAGLNTLLLNVEPRKSYQPALMMADQLQVDGVIFLAAVLPDEFVHIVQDIRHLPLVVLYRNSGVSGVHVVHTDDYLGGCELADVLLTEGHRRIGCVTGPPPGSTLVDRVRGFEETLKARGVAITSYIPIGNYSHIQAYETLARLDDQVWKALDAIFCENDSLAMAALDVIRERNLDVAVVGFDGIPEGGLPTYELTTYRQPIEHLAEEAIRRLTDGGLGEKGSRYFAPGDLQLRQSHIKPSRR